MDSREPIARFADHDPLVMSDPPRRPRRWPAIATVAALVAVMVGIAVRFSL